jgi:DNA-directed RNA polymerase specialized sigma24 family protein
MVALGRVDRNRRDGKSSGQIKRAASARGREVFCEEASVARMRYFPTTRWSVVFNAGEGSEETAKAALEELCRIYWYPLYAYTRSLGDGPHDAEDLVQGFLAKLVERNLAGRAQPEKGRFRSFLLQCFKQHRLKCREKQAAIKRGGHVEFLPLGELGAEERFGSELHDRLTPERVYERNWAISVLDRAHSRLAANYSASGKGNVFQRLQSLLQGDREGPAYARLAAELGKSESAIKMEVSRMRAQFRKLLREVVLETVMFPGEADEELRYLLTVLST